MMVFKKNHWNSMELIVGWSFMVINIEWDFSENSKARQLGRVNAFIGPDYILVSYHIVLILNFVGIELQLNGLMVELHNRCQRSEICWTQKTSKTDLNTNMGRRKACRYAWDMDMVRYLTDNGESKTKHRMQQEKKRHEIFKSNKIHQ